MSHLFLFRIISSLRLHRKALGGRKYNIYDLACFLCLASSALSREVRRKAPPTGIFRRGSRYHVQRCMNMKTVHLGTCGTLSEAKELYARGVRMVRKKLKQLVYLHRNSYIAHVREGGARKHLGAFRSKTAALAAIRQYHSRLAR